jgi:hypothetical protein
MAANPAIRLLALVLTLYALFYALCYFLTDIDIELWSKVKAKATLTLLFTISACTKARSCPALGMIFVPFQCSYGAEIFTLLIAPKTRMHTWFSYSLAATS